MIVEYVILKGDQSENLQERVNQLLQTGWQPSGPASKDKSELWFQTMTRSRKARDAWLVLENRLKPHAPLKK
jgi:hypothetical protein